MAYSFLFFLVVAALVLFLAKVTLGGGILGVVALAVLVWILFDLARTRRSRL